MHIGSPRSGLVPGARNVFSWATRHRRIQIGTLVVGGVVGVCVSPALAAPHSSTKTATTTVVAPVTATATNAGADLSWAAAAGSPSSYNLLVRDRATGSSFTARTHGAYTQDHLSDLANGDTYDVTVLAEPGDVPVGAASFKPVAPPLATPAAPTITSVSPATLTGGGAGLVVRFAPQSTTSGIVYDAAAAFNSSWKLVSKGVAPPSSSGASITFGPLAANATYTIGAAANSAGGQGAITWLSATTGGAGCDTAACLTVTPTGSTFKTTANGILDSVPPSGNVAAFTGLRPAMFRVNTGYGSWPGSGQLLAPTSAPVIENLADTWWYKTYTDATGGAQPPWECWSCYSRFISSQVSSIEASGTRPVYWEIENEPGHPGGTYPDHLQGNAALDLQQLEVAAAAIRKIDPDAEVLAPTNGYFLLGTTNLDQPFLSLDAVLANAAKIPGLAGLDWHEIDPGNVTPALAADDVAMAKTVESIYGRVTFANVVSEYTTPQDAPLAGAEGIWLGSLTRAGVTFASRSCWTDQPGEGTSATTCGNTLADGLFDSSGALTAPGETDQLYANLAGSGGHAATVATTSRDVAGTAAVADDGTVRVLLGREASCLPLVNPACPSGSTPSPAPKTVTVMVPMSGAPTVATVVTVPATIGATAPVTTTTAITYGGGVATVTVSVADGTAVELIL